MLPLESTDIRKCDWGIFSALFNRVCCIFFAVCYVKKWKAVPHDESEFNEISKMRVPEPDWTEYALESAYITVYRVVT